jgi:hypothetical protein
MKQKLTLAIVAVTWAPRKRPAIDATIGGDHQ